MAEIEEKYRFSSREELVESAKTSGEMCPDYERAIFLYYIARYYVAVFEARNHQLPIQVFNEYRNALDHFMRHLTGDEYKSKEGSQKTAMEKHMLRASLDIMKILCVSDSDWIGDKLKEYERDSLELVDNGEFIKFVSIEQINCKTRLEKAKTSDQSFGNSNNDDDKILELYMDAVISHENLRTAIEKKVPELENARSQSVTLKKKGGSLSIWSNIIIGIFLLFLGAIISEVTKTKGFNVSTSAPTQQISSEETATTKKTPPKTKATDHD